MGDPRKAAEELIAKYPHCRIDTILIDETPQGRTIAEAVSINGWVRPAYSFVQLNTAVTSGRAAALRQSLSGTTQKRYALEFALANATEQPAPAMLTMSSPSTFSLTPSSLANEIVPFLFGVEELQRTACDINREPYQGSLSSISRASPVSINVSGVEKALDALAYIFPWRREYARRIAEAKLEKLQAETAKIRAEAAEGFANARKVGAEAERIEAEAKELRLEQEMALVHK